MLISTFCLVLSLASNTSANKKKILIEKQIKIEIEKEKKYSREQAFYTYDYYDFKGAEVNVDSLDSIPELEMDDLDMDSVYD